MATGTSAGPAAASGHRGSMAVLGAPRVRLAHLDWSSRAREETPKSWLVEAKSWQRRPWREEPWQHCLAGAAAVPLLAVRRQGAHGRRRGRSGFSWLGRVALGQSASGIGEAPPDEVEVASYNVLSSHLAQPWYFWHNNPEDLAASTRLKRVLKKLQPLLQRGAVICLQECSQDWASFLLAFFQRKGYTFIHSLYGRRFNGYMGVGIAFPNGRYDLESVSLQRVSEGKHWADVARPEVQTDSGSLLPLLMDQVGYFGSPMLFQGHRGQGEEEQEKEQPEIDVWDYARERENTMVALKLRPRKGEDKTFTVATYHMPCAYWAPKVMVIHAALAAQCALRFADGQPLVLAGDWNFKPGAAPYQLLTTGVLPEAHPAHPGQRAGESWRVDMGLTSLRSVYAESNPGGEPEFTNYAWTRDDTDPFIGTIDYIFVSQQAEVLSVGRLPAIRSCPSPLPTSEEPSDHLMLSARLRPYGKPSTEKGQEGEKKGGLSRPAHVRKLRTSNAGGKAPVSAGKLPAARGRGFGGFGRKGTKAKQSS